MKDITTKVGYDGIASPAPATAVHTADEYNDRNVELQNAVGDADLVLDIADTHQLAKAMFANGVAAGSMLDSGGVNTVALTPVRGANGLQLPIPITPDYTGLDGAVFLFRANNTNSGNVTVNVGQTTGTLLGAKKLFQTDTISQIPAGGLTAGVFYMVLYRSTLDSNAGGWILMPRVDAVTATAPIVSSGGVTPNISVTLDTDGTLAANSDTKIASQQAVKEYVDGVWVDYSNMSMVVGWSSFITKAIIYRKIGKTVQVKFQLVGASNLTSASFTLPFTSKNDCQTIVIIYTVDSGLPTAGGELVMDVNTTVVNLYKTPITAAFTASGHKEATGGFSYECQ